MPPAVRLGSAFPSFSCVKLTSSTSRLRLAQSSSRQSICLFCSLSTLYNNRQPGSRRPCVSQSIHPGPRSLPLSSSRYPSSTRSTTSGTNFDPRADLKTALIPLDRYARHPRRELLDLAHKNLSEPLGQEHIRVAIIALTDQSTGHNPSETAKRLVKALFADPLSPEAEWERELDGWGVQEGRPVLLNVEGQPRQEEEKPRDIEVTMGRWLTQVPKIKVESPVWKEVVGQGGLEVLIMAGSKESFGGDGAYFEISANEVEKLLIPNVDMSAIDAYWGSHRIAVHLAVIVGEGKTGRDFAWRLLPRFDGEKYEREHGVVAAVNFQKPAAKDPDRPDSILHINVDAATEGLSLFRSDIANAKRYHTLWSQSGVSRLSDWLKSLITSPKSAAGKTVRPAVYNLISSLLHNARINLNHDKDWINESVWIGEQMLDALRAPFQSWAREAHQELQDQLDNAFSSKQWRQLRWWNLFWHADDVGMVTSDLVSKHFLPRAEKELIYLAGRFQEIKNGHTNKLVQYDLPAGMTDPSGTKSKWPLQIPYTRSYILTQSVPALQALAQSLVIQSASLIGATSALAGLSYLWAGGSLGLYECGAIAALGAIVALRRLQQKWDAARKYWEEEVREEGRKALRAVEKTLVDAFKKAKDEDTEEKRQVRELEGIEKIIERAERELKRLR